MKKKIYWLWTPVAISVFLFFVVYFTESNRSIFIFLNQLSVYPSPEFWSVITNFGNGLVISALFLFFVWKKPEILWKWLLIAIFVTIFIRVLKPIFHYPRPWVILNIDEFIHFGDNQDSFSFPSAHTSTIFAFTGLLIFTVIQDWKRWIVITFAILVGISRIFVGAHWTLDILGGIFVGWISAILGIVLSKKFNYGANKFLQNILIGLLFVICIILIFFYDPCYGETVLWSQRVIAAVCLIYAILGKIGIFRKEG